MGHATDYVILAITLEGEGRTLVKLIKISKLSIQSVASPSTMAEGPSEEENPSTAAGTAPPKRYSNSFRHLHSELADNPQGAKFHQGAPALSIRRGSVLCPTFEQLELTLGLPQKETCSTG